MPDARLPLTVAVLFLLGGALLHLTHRTRGVPGERRRRDWLKYWIYVALINALWLSAYLGVAAAGLLLAVIAVSGTIEVFRITRAPYRGAAGVAAGLAFPAALAHLLMPPAAAWQARFAFVVIVTASTDSFAEITGRLLGRRKLCPRLSPGKTVEGLGGALLMAVAVAWALGFLVPGANGLRLPLLGLLTAVAAVFGDLLFSAVKRAAGIKDFSRALPGHGGVLDRFDSLLLAAPVFYWSCALLLE